MFRHTSKELSVGILVTGISMINVPIVFADSRILKHDTKQNANCDTVGAGSPVSDSNPSTGTLLIRKSCVISGGGSCLGNPSFNVQVTGNNAQTTSFSISNGGGQSVTLGGGSFTVREAAAFGFTPSFSGDCMQTAAGSGEATGTISSGQQLTCTITNTIGHAPLPGVLLVNKVCVTPSGGSCQDSFNVQVTCNNPQPSSFSLSNGNSQAVGLKSGVFTVSEDSVSGFTTSFSGDCTQSSSNSQETTGIIAAGQHLTCTITNTAVPATGTLTVNKICVESSNPGDCERTGTGQFEIRITGNNPNPPGIELRGGGSQDFTLGSGSFTITETTVFPFTTFSGDCMLL